MRLRYRLLFSSCRFPILFGLRHRWGVCFKEMLVILGVDENIHLILCMVRRTIMIFSNFSSRFTLRISCASSNVIRCSRVKLSVADPEFALPTPATSLAIPACGECLASSTFLSVTNRRMKVNVYSWRPASQPQGRLSRGYENLWEKFER